MKRFTEPEDYARAKYEIFLRSDPQHKYEIVLRGLSSSDDAKLRSELEKLHRKLHDSELVATARAMAQQELEQELSALHGHAVQKYLLEEYKDDNLSRPFWRWVSLGLYIGGCGILIWLLAIRSIDVFRDYREGSVVIYSEKSGDDLQLLTYAFLPLEFDTLESVLKRADITPNYSSLEEDRQHRKGRRYFVPSSYISQLEATLRGTFSQTGEFAPTRTGGNPYACKEKKLGGADGKGCENITAVDEDAASVSCSMIAAKRRWFYAKARPGRCSDE